MVVALSVADTSNGALVLELAAARAGVVRVVVHETPSGWGDDERADAGNSLLSDLLLRNLAAPAKQRSKPRVWRMWPKYSYTVPGQGWLSQDQQIANQGADPGGMGYGGRGAGIADRERAAGALKVAVCMDATSGGSAAGSDANCGMAVKLVLALKGHSGHDVFETPLVQVNRSNGRLATFMLFKKT